MTMIIEVSKNFDIHKFDLAKIQSSMNQISYTMNRTDRGEYFVENVVKIANEQFNSN